MPLYRRLPKLVGKGLGRDGHQKANFGLLKLSVLNKCADNSEVGSLVAGTLTLAFSCSSRTQLCRWCR